MLLLARTVAASCVGSCLGLAAFPFAALGQACDGLVGHWSFEESGSVVADSSGLGNHGTAFGSPVRVPGVSGQGLALDGLDDFVEIADSASLNPASALTISAWWFSTSFSGSGSDPIVDKGASCHCYPYYQYQLGVSGDRYAYPSSFSFIAAAGGLPGGAGTVLRFYTVGRWYHIVGTYDGSEARMYVDGVLVDQNPVTGQIVSYGKPVRFGRFNNLGQFYLPGVIDEIRVYDRALSADEAALLHESPAGEPVVEPQLVTTCPGGEVTFRVRHLSIAGGGGATYQWFKDGVATAFTGSTLTVSAAETAGYSCVVTASCGGGMSSEARVVVCRPDFNCDGFLDFFDYDAFVQAFETGGGLDADFNGDGFVDFFDYDDFVAAFELGC